MTGKESQVAHIAEEQPQQQKKARRRSLFQISKGQMISTKELLLQKLKPNSASQKRSEEIESPLASPVELPHIKQLEPINTDISSEIQLHQQEIKNDREKSIEDGAQDIPDQVNQVNVPQLHPIDKNNNENKNQHQDDDKNVEKTQTASGDDNNVAEVVDPHYKKDQTIVKRSSILLKYLFLKKGLTTNTDDVILTESTIVENHQQTELGAGSDSVEYTHKQDRGDSTEEIIKSKEEKKGTEAPSPDRPSSPLGRRIDAFLSRIPTHREKSSSANISKPMETKSGVDDENTKKESITADDIPDTNDENGKVATITPTANHSIVAA